MNSINKRQSMLILNISTARLAQSAERKALNLVVVGSSPTVGAIFLEKNDDNKRSNETTQHQ